ncbi:MAG: TCP-1/cpn60 chaperonin family protein, partial [Dehalococcoidia bacterium]|nr:TCP-1/cpn60 chaperonin family protein [Dehalococcoidia bacterium]
PLRLIAENAGQEGSVVVDAVKRADKPDYGYDAAVGENGNRKEKGIIDPTKVVRAALENAASIASMLLTTESLITEIPEERPMMPPGPPPEF